MKARITAISLFLLISSMSISAQSASAVPAPSQFATAHTAFLASGSAPAAGARQALVSEMVYSSLYRSLTAWGQYHLLAAPADAEFSMVISTEMFVSDATNGSSIPYPYLRLEIYDTKTHALLWALDEPVQGAWREKTFEKNIDEAVASLTADLKTLASGSIPGNPSTTTVPAATKTRFSDEGKK